MDCIFFWSRLKKHKKYCLRKYFISSKEIANRIDVKTFKKSNGSKITKCPLIKAILESMLCISKDSSRIKILWSFLISLTFFSLILLTNFTQDRGAQTEGNTSNSIWMLLREGCAPFGNQLKQVLFSHHSDEKKKIAISLSLYQGRCGTLHLYVKRTNANSRY